MTMRQLESLKAGGHSFHPVFEVCRKCGIARQRYVKDKKQKCVGKRRGPERVAFDPEDDESN